MSDFRRVAIRNYRSIVKADLKLGRITIVIGPSDTGKSNLVRALRDWSYNCTSKTMITKGKTTARIAVAIGDATKVIFERCLRGTKRGSARYVVRDGETHEVQSYEKIGRTVPHEVTAITGVFPVTIDDLALRIQVAEQAEPWFLLSNPPWTAGQVSRVVGKISGLDALIAANRDLINRRTTFEREEKRSVRAAQDLEVELKQFDTVAKQRSLMATAEGTMERVQEKRQRLRSASELITAIAEHKKLLKATEAFLDAAGPLVEELGSIDLSGKREKLDRAESILDRVAGLKKRKAGVEGDHKKAQKALDQVARQLKQTAKSGDLTCPLCGESAHQECRSNMIEQARVCGTAKRGNE